MLFGALDGLCRFEISNPNSEFEHRITTTFIRIHDPFEDIMSVKQKVARAAKEVLDLPELPSLESIELSANGIILGENEGEVKSIGQARQIAGLENIGLAFSDAIRISIF